MIKDQPQLRTRPLQNSLYYIDSARSHASIVISRTDSCCDRFHCRSSLRSSCLTNPNSSPSSQSNSFQSLAVSKAFFDLKSAVLIDSSPSTAGSHQSQAGQGRSLAPPQALSSLRLSNSTAYFSCTLGEGRLEDDRGFLQRQASLLMTDF